MFLNNLSKFSIIRKRFSIYQKRKDDKLIEFVLINRLSKKNNNVKRMKLSEINKVLLKASVITK